MTHYERIMSMDVDTLAMFLYIIINETERKMLSEFSRKYGITLTQVSAAPHIVAAQHKQYLLQEVPKDE